LIILNDLNALGACNTKEKVDEMSEYNNKYSEVLTKHTLKPKLVLNSLKAPVDGVAVDGVAFNALLLSESEDFDSEQFNSFQGTDIDIRRVGILSMAMHTALEYLDAVEHSFDLLGKPEHFLSIAKDFDLLINSTSNSSDYHGKSINNDRPWVYREINFGYQDGYDIFRNIIGLSEEIAYIVQLADIMFSVPDFKDVESKNDSLQSENMDV